MLSTRIYKLHRLIRQANDQQTDWLIANLRDPSRYATPLSTIACLRVVASRINTSGLPYREKMRATRAQIGI